MTQIHQGAGLHVFYQALIWQGGEGGPKHFAYGSVDQLQMWYNYVYRSYLYAHQKSDLCDDFWIVGEFLNVRISALVWLGGEGGPKRFAYGSMDQLQTWHTRVYRLYFHAYLKLTLCSPFWIVGEFLNIRNSTGVWLGEEGGPNRFAYGSMDQLQTWHTRVYRLYFHAYLKLTLCNPFWIVGDFLNIRKIAIFGHVLKFSRDISHMVQQISFKPCIGMHWDSIY